MHTAVCHSRKPSQNTWNMNEMFWLGKLWKILLSAKIPHKFSPELWHRCWSRCPRYCVHGCDSLHWNLFVSFGFLCQLQPCTLRLWRQAWTFLKCKWFSSPPVQLVLLVWMPSLLHAMALLPWPLTALWGMWYPTIWNISFTCNMECIAMGHMINKI